MVGTLSEKTLIDEPQLRQTYCRPAFGIEFRWLTHQQEPGARPKESHSTLSSDRWSTEQASHNGIEPVREFIRPGEVFSPALHHDRIRQRRPLIDR